jgi:hypothetical protein
MMLTLRQLSQVLQITSYHKALCHDEIIDESSLYGLARIEHDGLCR